MKWPKEGTVSSGKCTTPKIMECHKIESASTLLGIMETDVPADFYLSEKQTQQFLTRL